MMNQSSVGPYTVYKSEHEQEIIRIRIESDMEHIVSRMIDRFGSNLVGIFLVGGFGRGEGSVIVDVDQIHPVNDYDLVAVIDNECDLSGLKKIRCDLANKIGIRWIDITVFTRSKLSRLKFSIYAYDLKYSSQTIFGDSSVLEIIPEMDSKKLPLEEAEYQFYTRLWCFLGPLKYGFQHESYSEKEDRFFLANQLSKATLACSDSMLILNGSYHPSYIERIKRLENLLSPGDKLLELTKTATIFKLQPTMEVKENLIDKWKSVRLIYLETMWHFVQHMYGRNFADWPAYGWWYRNNPKKLIHRIGHVALRRNLNFEKALSVHIAQLFLLLANSGDEYSIDMDLLERANNELRKISNQTLSKADWEKSRELAVRLRMDI